MSGIKMLGVFFVMAVMTQTVFSQEGKRFSQRENINRHNTAVVLIEFQKTWTEKGFFNWLIREEYESRKVLDNTTHFVRTARRLGFSVVQAPLILDKEDKERYTQVPFFPKLMQGFTRGTWKAEFAEGIYEETDAVVKGRCGFDATECSDLEEILEKKGIKNIFFCGFTTDHCVDVTMKRLISKGYNCILISDCTAARNADIQKKVEKRNKTMSSFDAIKLFGGGDSFR